MLVSWPNSCAGMLSQVYHGQNSTATLKELGHTYTTLTEDTTRVMGRLKALYCSQAIATDGKKFRNQTTGLAYVSLWNLHSPISSARGSIRDPSSATAVA